ncbi:type IV pilus modification PilV family protein [Truepera radiovictrix]|uniref:Pilin, type IV n=1 Tax=Truepera radiovictrix (strain DSM 17093 / CIP 108686 / LMG 22925 / RQ-24) TaxID=649638 RepID=D7CWN3_TRURR|nr:prepilin-type N-terminal cleavage/methylation domain-containing protein [Truepera radiovictrix]ADI14432.1 putative pilin, type IV [Truepera radiovictrix DSM 17093]WMT57011.1 prepilin-type N-terminal cleavage/methylation domain-containing protein [Truepera radiovictrix]
MKSARGLTLLEVLASIVILGVLMTVVLSPLTQLFARTAVSGRTLRLTTQAQEIAESIRGQWRAIPYPADGSQESEAQQKLRAQNRERYEKTCFQLPRVSGARLQLEVWALDRRGNEVSRLTWHETCPATSPATIPPLKRLKVTLSADDGTQSHLTLDVPKP